MYYYTFVAVSGQEDGSELTKEVGKLLDSLSNAIKNASKPFSNETTFGDFLKMFNKTKDDSKPKSLSKRDVTSTHESLSRVKDELKRKCNIYGSPDNYNDVAVSCVDEI